MSDYDEVYADGAVPTQLNPDDAVHEDNVEILEDNNDDLDERRRMAALQVAASIEHPTIEDLLNAAQKVNDYLANGQVTAPKGPEGTNSEWIGDENTAV